MDFSLTVTFKCFRLIRIMAFDRKHLIMFIRYLPEMDAPVTIKPDSKAVRMTAQSFKVQGWITGIPTQQVVELNHLRS